MHFFGTSTLTLFDTFNSVVIACDAERSVCPVAYALPLGPAEQCEGPCRLIFESRLPPFNQQFYFFLSALLPNAARQS